MFQADSARAPDNPNKGYHENRIIVSVEPKDTTAGVGAYVNLTVVVRSPKPTFQWFNGEGNKIIGKRESNLFIGPIQEKDFGFYRLEIMDETLRDSTLSRWVELKNANPPKQYTHPITPIQSIQPVLLEAPRGGVFQRGSTVNLCGHFANASYFQWYKNGALLSGCDGNTLIIKNSGFENSGLYVLLAANEANQYIQVPVSVQIQW